ncbi:Lsr2 protein [Jatrophihabitans endophyticus]|uniref:Lsr2 protein n=1 Tax=Jatrophihabitans endophyticus TaxID=1206085 RepID=A0A1M5HAZ2_9ACTN|nr:Lsr2 family protein [Jatrophihabitans endophyticus]SHG13107.1 Lsr2 protein [Jatrophihabitans endophyticus]
MATKTITVSDLSGVTDGVETISFALAGQAYTLDLTAKEREEFLKAFERYTAVATPAAHTRGASKPKAEKSGPTQAQLMREWAKANGVELPAKGVVPKEVRAQYREAMAKDGDATASAPQVEVKATPAPVAPPAKQAPAKAAPAKAVAPKETSASK